MNINGKYKGIRKNNPKIIYPSPLKT